MAEGRTKHEPASRAAKAKVRPPRLYIYFDAVANQGSIRKAAERLYMASSALTRQILDLEDQAGTALFERVPSGVRLTPAGELLHVHVREALEGLNAACLHIDDLGGLVRGVVRIASTETVAVERLPKVIGTFQTIHPGVTFEISVMNGQVALGKLLSDQVDMAVLLNPTLSAGVQVQKTSVQQTCAIVRADHPLASKNSVSLEECATYPLGMPEVGMGGRALLDDLAARHSLQLIPSMVANSIEVLKGFVRYSDGVAFQLSSGVTRNVRRGEVCAVPLADSTASKLVVVTRKGRVLAHASLSFLEHLKDSLWT